MKTQTILKRLRNWQMWVATFSLVGFLFVKLGAIEAKDFLDELMPYLYCLGISLGIWADYEEEERKTEKEE
ncbi:hypothetical protein [Bacillus sp. Fil]|uniref:hypothetical protein n=1 Tax=Bacillus sp. Fil TaxID=3459567 RepID=UPI001C5BBBEF|nr:hypothetical protein [Bacillus sp. FDAARGOS_1420]MBW3496252.1 hypothetical protein [Bacillus sp. FDAARGOS_1420]